VKKIYEKVLIAMDNSNNAFNAARKVVEMVKELKPKRPDKLDDNERKYVKSNDLPDIIAFHSSEHHSFLEKIPIGVSSSFGAGYPIPSVDYDKIKEEYKLHGQNILKKTEKLFERENIDIETKLITDEKPEDYIEKVVEDENIDLVVLGSKGEHSKIEQFFSGSIAQKVVNNVPCDILIVR
jgi:nucleotide-binding universal stress UspA family protein